jgi:5-methylcytosine-specific restriction protein A
MAKRPLAYCSVPGCSARVSAGRCAAHRGRPVDDRRLPAHRRGYGRDWQRLRARLIQGQLCADCEAAGYIVIATELHHVIRISVDPRRRLDPDNLLPLCKLHHSIRTRRGE